MPEATAVNFHTALRAATNVLSAQDLSGISNQNQAGPSPSAESALITEALLYMQLETNFISQVGGGGNAGNSFSGFGLRNFFSSIGNSPIPPASAGFGLTSVSNTQGLAAYAALGTPQINSSVTAGINQPSIGSLPSSSTTQQYDPSFSGISSIMPLINELAPRYGLDPKLVAAVVQQESGFSPTATSSSGAMGLMQLMPSTAKMLGVTNAYNPVSNLEGGMKYLSGLLTRYHDNTALALAAYNAGPGAVDAFQGIPPYSQTQSYVASILQQFNNGSLA